jgi:thiol-disulfide isomerase/thioredoxin
MPAHVTDHPAHLLAQAAEGQIALDVVCLCAEWCGTCREYRDSFSALAAALPAHHYRWIDIEDEADLVGDVDVETFPTLMVVHQGRVLFAGPVLPRLGDAQRLLETLTEALGRGVLPTVAVAADQAQAYDELARTLTAKPGA